MTTNQFVLTHPSFENVKFAAKHIVSEMDKEGFRPDRIIALARGGAILGVILSHRLNVPVTIVSYSSKKGKGDDRNHDNALPKVEGVNLLIVDDLTDSGHSMAEVVAAYQNGCASIETSDSHIALRSDHVIRTATMYAKEGAVLRSDYYWHWLPKNSPFIHFPWETE